MNDLIKKIDFFSGLDDKILNKISDACIARQFTKNETMVRQGEMGLGLYIIARGKVKVEREEGGVRKPLAELGPEQFFGDMSLLDNKPRSATVTGVEDTECLLLTRDSFVRLMTKYPEIPIRMARVLAERLRAANDLLAKGAPAPAPVAPAAPQEASGSPAPSATASAAPVAAASAAPTGNGAAASPAAPEGTKAQIRSTLLSTFQSLYMLKALSRFTVAVLGCPVEGISPSTVEQIRVGDVKALFFPADGPFEMNIRATEPGSFTLDVFTPSAFVPYHFGPVRIDPADKISMISDSAGIKLVRRDNVI